MRVLAISYLFPNSTYPNYGVFVLNRLKAVQKYCDIKVINPVPYFPFSSRLSRYRGFSAAPSREILDGLEVFHPRFFVVPRYLKALDCITFCTAVLQTANRIQNSFPFDIIDLHWTYPDMLSGRRLARATNKKSLVTIRGAEALHLGETSLRKVILDQLIRQYDGVITLSQELAEICAQIGVRNEKINVIPNGVDTSTFFFKMTGLCRARLGIPSGSTIILTVGSVIYRKGFDRIIRAMPRILQLKPDTHLYIAGTAGPEGDYSKSLLALITALGLQNNVHLVGELRNTELVDWYNAADLFCLASRGEGSPNVVNEALACGCPTVATNVGTVTEVLATSSMGQVVPNDDESIGPAIFHALQCNYDRQRIATYMTQFNWDSCAKKVVDYYHEVMMR